MNDQDLINTNQGGDQVDQAVKDIYIEKGVQCIVQGWSVNEYRREVIDKGGIEPD